MSRKDNSELVFCPLGGVGEIGMNFALYGFGPAEARTWMIVDCGVTFPDLTLPGVDLVLPDIRFIEERLDRLAGIVITHAHEDHYGALLDLWPRLKAQVWMTPFAAGMLASKREGEAGAPKVPVNIYEAGERFKVGPFDIEAIAVTHSIPEPVSLAIRTPLGTLLHTGDWKLDPEPEIGPLTDEARFRELGDEGVLAMMCDSTNALREGESPSEMAVSRGLARSDRGGEVSRRRDDLFLQCRPHPLHRGSRARCRPAGAGSRPLHAACDRGRRGTGLPGGPAALPVGEDYGYVPRENVVVLCTGSQGEGRAALGQARPRRDAQRRAGGRRHGGVLLARHPRQREGDPRNQEPLIDREINVIEDTDALIHVSGHPRRIELRQMYEWVRPHILVPVHGEAAHLAGQAKLARESGIPGPSRSATATCCCWRPATPGSSTRCRFGRIFKDGRLIGTDEAIGVRDRRRLVLRRPCCGQCRAG
jgi:ribonuclease J